MRKFKRYFKTICCILAVALLAGLVLNLYGVFDKKTVNKDNLVNAELDGYVSADTYNNGYGVKYTVSKNGEIRATGTATADDIFTVMEGITLTAGKTYTLSCGNSSVGYKTYGLRLHDTTATSGSANEYVYAELDGTFTIDSSDTDNKFNLEIYVMKDTKVVLATFKPVLVEGNTAGDFLTK